VTTGSRHEEAALERGPKGEDMGTTEVMVAQPASETQALSPRQDGGVMGLARLSEHEFEARLKEMKAGQDRIRRVQRELMNEDEDFGVIPGTNKPGLFKAGAEKLCMVYGLRASYEPVVVIGDGLTAPVIRVRMLCRLHVGSTDGAVVGEGVGAASSWERKHRYRRGERACPECGVVGSVIRGKADFGGGFLCWAKKDGCGAKFDINDERITEQAVGDVENTDQFDLENTLLKMAKKRAYVDATLTACAASGLFTQDVEDRPVPEEPRNPAPRSQAAAPAQREPGEDDPEDMERRGYEAHGVEPPTRTTTARAPKPAQNSRPASGPTVTCPHCGKPAGPSKFPKPGREMYCYPCRAQLDKDGNPVAQQ
jgi:hypothetical protein